MNALFHKEKTLPFDARESPSAVEQFDESSRDDSADVFVERPDHQIHYKTLSWQVRETVF